MGLISTPRYRALPGQPVAQEPSRESAGAASQLEHPSCLLEPSEFREPRGDRALVEELRVLQPADPIVGAPRPLSAQWHNRAPLTHPPQAVQRRCPDVPRLALDRSSEPMGG